MTTNKATVGLTIGFVLGAATGLILALLLTPKSGKQTRELIRDQVTEIPTAVKEQTADRKRIYQETWEARKGRPKISPSYFE
jgi:gas vesicle protein